MIAGFDFRNCSLEGLRDVLERFAGRLNVIWDKEHKVDGSHGHVTADSVTADTIRASEQLLVSPYDLAPDDLPLTTDRRLYYAITQEETEFSDSVMRIRARSNGDRAVHTTYLVPQTSTGVGSSVGEYMEADFLKAASGIQNLMATLEIDGADITGSGATVLVSAALYISNPGSGATNNYAIYANNGPSQFDEIQLSGDVLPDFADTNDLGSVSQSFRKTFGGAWVGRVVTPAALGASQNNYSPTGLSSAYVLALSATGPINITGLDATGFEDGRPLIIANIGAPIITLTHEDVASSATNRWFFYDAANRAMGNGRSVMMHRNPSLNNRWVLVGA